MTGEHAEDWPIEPYTGTVEKPIKRREDDVSHPAPTDCWEEDQLEFRGHSRETGDELHRHVKCLDCGREHHIVYEYREMDFDVPEDPHQSVTECDVDWDDPEFDGEVAREEGECTVCGCYHVAIYRRLRHVTDAGEEYEF